MTNTILNDLIDNKTVYATSYDFGIHHPTLWDYSGVYFADLTDYITRNPYAFRADLDSIWSDMTTMPDNDLTDYVIDTMTAIIIIRALTDGVKSPILVASIRKKVARCVKDSLERLAKKLDK